MLAGRWQRRGGGRRSIWWNVTPCVGPNEATEGTPRSLAKGVGMRVVGAVSLVWAAVGCPPDAVALSLRVRTNWLQTSWTLAEWPAASSLSSLDGSFAGGSRGIGSNWIDRPRASFAYGLRVCYDHASLRSPRPGPQLGGHVRVDSYSRGLVDGRSCRDRFCRRCRLWDPGAASGRSRAGTLRRLALPVHQSGSWPAWAPAVMPSTTLPARASSPRSSAN